MAGARRGSATASRFARRVSAKATMPIPNRSCRAKTRHGRGEPLDFARGEPLDFARGGRHWGWVATDADIVPDSEQSGLIGALPAAVRPYASLIRLDRPIGAWLLFWPGAWAVALAGMGGGATDRRGWTLIVWLALGAWAMRSAGCV